MLIMKFFLQLGYLSQPFSLQKYMIEKNNEFQSVLSDSQEVVISQDCPIIEASSQGSLLNRMGKCFERVKQHEWISQIDMFSTSLKLNYNGQDTYKTQFGGIIYLMVMLVCILLTVYIQFKNGLTLGSNITLYNKIFDAGNTQTIFDHSDTFLEIYYLNIQTKERASPQVVQFILRGLHLYQVLNGVTTELQIQTNCNKGIYCVRNSQINKLTTIFGKTTSSNSGYIQMQYVNCPLEQISPDFGACYLVTPLYSLVFQVTTFSQVHGAIQQKVQKFTALSNVYWTYYMDRYQYTTNNNFLGHIANTMPYQIDYYKLVNNGISLPYTRINTDFNCYVSYPDNGGFCTFVRFAASGTTYIVTQNFDDITAPVLFFLSLSQTLFYLIYLLFLRNYTANALNLSIADSLAFLPHTNGKHHNFKTGFSTFFTCMLYNHPFIDFIDLLLYRFCQTQMKRFYSIKMQLTIDMIQYGRLCIGQKKYFQLLNRAYDQQNLQPAKIVVDLPKEQPEEQQEEEEEIQYFEEDMEKQAFRRMCEEHQYWTAKRKKHLYNMLNQKGKGLKVITMTQELFGKYKTQVRGQRQSKEVELPISYLQDQLSDMNIIKKNRENFD